MDTPNILRTLIGFQIGDLVRIRRLVKYHRRLYRVTSVDRWIHIAKADTGLSAGLWRSDELELVREESV